MAHRKAKVAAGEYPLEPLVGLLLSPLQRFLERTTAGGLVLAGTTALTLLLAGIVGDEALHHFFERTVSLAVVGTFDVKLSLHHLVNDGLMALFFLMVGLELKREMLVGELSSIRDAALPVVAAVGGMIVPAAIYTALNHGSAAASGWGIPMATDIAFAVGILVLLAWRIPKNLVIFLMALAIVDDLGAVAVIAMFYTSDIDLASLGAALAIVVALVLLNRSGVRRTLPYALLGLPLWFFVLESGVHATLAGIVLAFCIPVVPEVSALAFETRIKELRDAWRDEVRDTGTSDDPLTNERLATIAGAVEAAAIAAQSPLQRLERGLVPWVTFVVIPLFAIANAGIDLLGVSWERALSDPLTLGVVAGLALGKFVGISVFSWAAVALGIGRLPQGVAWKHVLGAAWLGGIGFTMSLFVAQLAFTKPELVEQAKVGILLGSAISAVIGLAWLYLAGSKREANG